MGKYKVGDELRVKQVEDMTCHLGIHFTSQMTRLCGRNFTVKASAEIPNIKGETVSVYRSYEETEKINYPTDGSRGYWLITDEMLEPREIGTSVEISTDELLKILRE